MTRDQFKKLTPNKAVNIFFSDELTPEEKASKLRETVSAESLFLGLVRETESTIKTGYEIPLEYTRAFFPDFSPSASFLGLVFYKH